jgi:uncharacterized protein (DUF2141 family)
MKMTLTKITLCLLFVSSGICAQGQLQLTVTNVKNTNGTIRVGLFNSEQSFLKTAVDGKIVKATGPELTVTFENLKPGDYGISVYHDENENAELDKNFMGIPKEGFAFGNNSMGTFGAPDFAQAKVRVEDKKIVSQTITLKYL